MIFLSGLTDLDDRVQGFQLGAVDFIAKPFQREELLASGLGLALAQKLANLHGGEIRVTSKLNEGSRVVVSLAQAKGEHE